MRLEQTKLKLELYSGIEDAILAIHSSLDCSLDFYVVSEAPFVIEQCALGCKPSCKCRPLYFVISLHMASGLILWVTNPTVVFPL